MSRAVGSRPRQGVPFMAGVSVEPFQQWVLKELAEGESLGKLAERFGYIRPADDRPSGIKGDVTAFQRRVGLKPNINKNGGKTTAEYIRYTTAEKFVKNLGLDPVDFGL